jgi:hypothetical protein
VPTVDDNLLAAGRNREAPGAANGGISLRSVQV